MRRTTLAIIVAAAAALAAPAAASALNVYAATSLANAFPALNKGPTYSFGGSNTLQTQIERGAPADVFASASLNEAQALFREGLCTRPVTGAYTRQLLKRMRLSGILSSNRVSQQTNVGQITSQVALGAADAGFVYHTDGLAVRNRTKMISLPKWAQPPVRYQICTVRRSGADTRGAAAFIKRVTGKAGRAALKAYGFGLPPRG